MIDFLKLRTSNRVIINRLLSNNDFVQSNKPINNSYLSLNHRNKKINLHFRKAFENGLLVGYNYLDITISPHYHKNDYLHNGDDFKPIECIKSICEILEYLRIDISERGDLQIVNIEFGINIIPLTKVDLIMKGLLFYKRSKFNIKYKEIETFKISDTTKYKEIKVYAKGLQFIDFPTYNIDINTMRFEVRIKQFKMIKSLGLCVISDLLIIANYKSLFQHLLKEWDNVFIIDFEFNKENFKTNELSYLKKCMNINFWENLLTKNHRNTFRNNTKKYFKTVSEIDYLHKEIKAKIIDKLLELNVVRIPYRNST